MTRTLRPLPASHHHYADPVVNDEAQGLPIDVAIDRIHYPTLGCPALLSRSPEMPLVVWLSLDDGADPRAAAIALVDRHGDGTEIELVSAEPPVSLGSGPVSRAGTRRTLWQLTLDVAGARPALYDLRARTASATETQPNAVRIYEAITGDEQVIFCGDSQYHGDNAACLERFIAAINARDDIAWVALIGDGCDNGVKSKYNMLKLVLGAGPSEVHSYYVTEFGDLGKRLLPKLNKPIVIVPGNHDGMTAYEQYAQGEHSECCLGPESGNRVAYDGLHHYRRTIGPLYFAFDWGKTRYLCMNSFELDRRERLGFHAVVANWGGFVRAEQCAWLEQELEDAAASGRHAVVLMHHDPRGGSEGDALGYYSDIRPYRFDSLVDIVISYARYVGSNASTWQQEWMKRPGDDAHLDQTRRLLALLLDHRVHGVIMGHDNENWVETYGEGDSIFSENRAVQFYRQRPPLEEAPSPAEVIEAEQRLDARDLAGLVKMLDEHDRGSTARGEGSPRADAVLEAAFERLAADGKLDPDATYAPAKIERWNLRARAPIHFIHVDDVGAYKHSRDRHFAKYGYVVAQLAEGRPIALQRTSLLGDCNDSIALVTAERASE
jgi:hypothetical protein